MLREEIYYIIGNAYKEFSRMPNAISYDEVLRSVESESNHLKYVYLSLGQGLNIIEKEKLGQLENEGKLGFIINRHHRLAPKKLSHKTKVHNTMISEPLLIDKDKKYTAYLLLDDDCAEMSDHITGMHLQGMVLTEAARQVMLAVGEKFILPDNLKGQSYFALRRVNSIYHQFAFPLDMQIIHEIKSLKIRGKICIVETVTTFIQNEKKVTEVEIDYIASDKQDLINKEALMAEIALQESASKNLSESYVDRCA